MLAFKGQKYLIFKTMAENQLNVKINGKDIALPHSMTAIQAVWHDGTPMVQGVGCLEGVCGACKAMVKRTGSNEVKMELACQTIVEDGMEVIFINLNAENHHRYEMKDIDGSWGVEKSFNKIFPEAQKCRHCGGCDVACPKGIEVEKTVKLSVEGKFKEAGELFLECVMCGLCLTSCPERITPNHVGLFARRATAFFHIRPSNLIGRIEDIKDGKFDIELE